MYLQQVKAELEAQDAVMVSVMVNDLDTQRKEAERFKIDTRAFPFARDESGEWGKKYGAWGKGMHSTNYGHGFVLIDKQGIVRWQVEEPSMYVAPKLIIQQLQEANAGPAES